MMRTKAMLASVGLLVALGGMPRLGGAAGRAPVKTDHATIAAKVERSRRFKQQGGRGTVAIDKLIPMGETGNEYHYSGRTDTHVVQGRAHMNADGEAVVDTVHVWDKEKWAQAAQMATMTPLIGVGLISSAGALVTVKTLTGPRNSLIRKKLRSGKGPENGEKVGADDLDQVQASKAEALKQSEGRGTGPIRP
jgi:hypothetical protein